MPRGGGKRNGQSFIEWEAERVEDCLAALERFPHDKPCPITRRSKPHWAFIFRKFAQKENPAVSLTRAPKHSVVPEFRIE